MFFLINVIYLTPLRSELTINDSIKDVWENESFYVYNHDINTVLFDHNSDVEMSVDNLNTLMAAVVLLEEVKVSNVSMDDVPSNLSMPMYIKKNEKLALKQILEGLIIYSSEDAMYIASRLFNKTEDEFLKEMNEKALELNMENTQYTSIYNSEENISTAKDQFLLANYVLNNFPEILEISKQPNFERNINNKTSKYENQNSFLKVEPTARGLKSGWGEKFHLITTIERDGALFSVVSLGHDSSRKRNTFQSELISEIFEHYHFLTIANENDIYKEWFIYRSDRNGPEPVLYQTDTKVLVPKNVETNQLTYYYTGKEYLVGGTSAGEVLGELIISYQDTTLAAVNIISQGDYPEGDWLKKMYDSVALFFNHFVLEWIESIF